MRRGGVAVEIELRPAARLAAITQLTTPRHARGHHKKFKNERSLLRAPCLPAPRSDPLQALGARLLLDAHFAAAVPAAALLRAARLLPLERGRRLALRGGAASLERAQQAVRVRRDHEPVRERPQVVQRAARARAARAARALPSLTDPQPQRSPCTRTPSRRRASPTSPTRSS